jgi:hypothetical protein
VRDEGARSCPGEAALRAGVAARLGYDPFFAWATRTIIVELEGAHRGFRARAKIVDGEGHVIGQRLLESPSKDCDDLIGSLALAISLAIDDLPVEPLPPVERDAPRDALATPEPPRATAIVAVSGEAEPPPAPPMRVRSWTFVSSAGIHGSLGTAPSPALGLPAGLGVRGSWWSLTVEGRSDFPVSMTLSDGGRLSSSLLLAGLVPCAHLRVGLFACLQGALGSFRGASDGISMPLSDSAFFAGAGGRVGYGGPSLATRSPTPTAVTTNLARSSPGTKRNANVGGNSAGGPSG